MANRADERRLDKVAAPMLSAQESVSAWSRAWIARRTHLQPLLQRRTRYLVALTQRRLLAFPLRYWSRRPRREALVLELAQLRVSDAGRGRRRTLVLERGSNAAVILYLGSSSRDQELADALLGARGSSSSDRSTDRPSTSEAQPDVGAPDPSAILRDEAAT